MVGVKIPRVGVKTTRGILTPGGQAAQGVKINCYTGFDPRPGRCVVSLSKRHLLPKSTGNTQE